MEKIMYSITHSPSLFDAAGTEALALRKIFLPINDIFITQSVSIYYKSDEPVSITWNFHTLHGLAVATYTEPVSIDTAMS